MNIGRQFLSKFEKEVVAPKLGTEKPKKGKIHELEKAVAEAVKKDEEETGVKFPKVKKSTRKTGEPKSGGRKVSINIRLDQDVLKYFEADGPGWQTRINEVLLNYVRGLE